jgi:hypothetical protein
MSDGARNSGILPDPVSVSPETPGAGGLPSVNETRSAQPDHAVAYLRSALKETRAADPKSESGLLGFLHRKRRRESAVGVQTSLTPRAFAYTGPALKKTHSEPAAFAAAVTYEVEPLRFDEDPSEPVRSEGAPSKPLYQQEESYAEVQAAQISPGETVQAEILVPPGDIPEAGASPEATATVPPIPESIPESATSASAETTPVEAAAEPEALHGEVLPPETLPSDRSTPAAAEPARVITMQPGVPRPATEPPPTEPT